MARYIYNGPMSAATLGDGTDVILFNGAEVDLPAANEWVKSLVAQKRLTPITKPAAQPAGAATTTTDTPKAQAEPAARKAAEKETK
ncbi:hypothetical protein ACDP63_16790 [Paracoccus sp. P2]|uniref:hypothetical protein n=1 Tax=Paracoccus sp. P2 TaxID=3248840 RepID=UPI00391EF9B3